jgi:hypothetical protein
VLNERRSYLAESHRSVRHEIIRECHAEAGFMLGLEIARQLEKEMA